MASNIGRDSERFRQIIKGRARKSLQDIIKKKEFIVRRGKGTVVIPVPNIDIPNFRHGKNKDTGIGQGEGEEGDIIGGAYKDDEDGSIAGQGQGEHLLEMTVEEAAEFLGEELKLPKIEPRGRRTIMQEFDRYHGLSRHGPRGLLRFKPTYRNALKRSIASGEYNPDDSSVMIIPEDMRFRSWLTKEVPESSAAIIYMMDVSGSMTDRHKGIARRISSWTDVWLRAHYRGLESAYVIHDYTAREVDEYAFYHTTTGGGTRIASGYLAVQQIIESRYSPDEWNIYLFQYSDGGNWGENEDEFRILEKHLLPKLNHLCYAQIDAYNGRYIFKGDYLQSLQEFAKGSKFSSRVLTAKLESEDDILAAIKTFLGAEK